MPDSRLRTRAPMPRRCSRTTREPWNGASSCFAPVRNATSQWCPASRCKSTAPLAQLRDKAEQLGKMGDAISAEVSRGRALGYYIERRESGAAGAFQAKTREEADKQLEDTIARIAAKQAIEKAKQKA